MLEYQLYFILSITVIKICDMLKKRYNKIKIGEKVYQSVENIRYLRVIVNGKIR